MNRVVVWNAVWNGEMNGRISYRCEVVSLEVHGAERCRKKNIALGENALKLEHNFGNIRKPEMLTCSCVAAT